MLQADPRRLESLVTKPFPFGTTLQREAAALQPPALDISLRVTGYRAERTKTQRGVLGVEVSVGPPIQQQQPGEGATAPPAVNGRPARHPGMVLVGCLPEDCVRATRAVVPQQMQHAIKVREKVHRGQATAASRSLLLRNHYI